MQRVLCHGDLWTPNILWKSEQGDIAPAALIDFQNGHMGSPANDLVRLFTTCLSGKDRREHWEELLEEFYGYLKEEAADLKLPYTLEQLKESCRQFMPFIGFLVVIAIGSYFELLSKDIDEEQKKKTLKVVMEKTICLLDDVLHYHDRNMKLRKEEQTV
ncbi:hypothetical protein NECAME_14160 [Necator americanus]|uniref:CHK kinase-like domain-containing protein n=1 Tax=Necator americanus TaxID=51031 RepID=W2SQ38_NECAM|nr:hypothetical protein NECAME_14160 [Necator americanus]ETN71643.1 hypothetical protein NECAME_14160 [Necator americanus]